MDVKIDRQSRTLLYLQIADQVKHLVATGRLRPGERLPAIRRLAADLGVARSTVAHAYRELNKDGVTSAQPGRGTFVSEPNRLQLVWMRREKLSSMFSKPFVEALSLGYSMQEIEEAVIEQLTRWWTKTHSPNRD